ncbi:MAG: M20/M25/M40 family metallo-hydrolase [Vicinamibacteria bacterium]|nr:M20/M25/M40 family metallo-hydrolase [Vicinamibacteria bacterium]
MRRVFVSVCVLVALSCPVAPSPAQVVPPSLVASSRQLLRDLIGINTAEPDGNTTTAATRVADVLKAAGFAAEDVQVIGADARRGNVVARLAGRGPGKPILFLAHLDVVPALREDWTTDPYTLVEKDGYYYGRGTTDDKQFAAIFAAVFAQLKREGFVPDRDLVLALTTGEESGADETANGVMWLLKHHRPLIDAAYVINGDAGGGMIASDGRYLGYGVQAAEKLYADFTLEATHDGGHSSRPVKGNPIYRIVRALSRVETLALPLKVGPVTQPFLAFLATTESGQKAADLRAAAATPPDPSALSKLADEDPSLNAQLRTTCVATQMTAGHAPNALPQRARANVNCRILPGETPAAIRAALVTAIDDTAVSVTQTEGVQHAPLVRLDPAVMALITRAAGVVWPGVPVVPVLEVGASDGLFFRELGVDVYGVYHFERDEDKRAHGKDERIGFKQFDEAARFSYELAKIIGR